MCDVRRCRREPELAYVVDGKPVDLCGQCWDKAATEGVDTAAWIRAHVVRQNGDTPAPNSFEAAAG